MFCPRCGRQIPQGAVFCMHCGQQIAQVEMPRGAVPVGYPPQPVAVPQSNKKSNVAIAVISTLIILLLLALGVWMNTLMRKATGQPAPVKVAGAVTPPPIAASRVSMPDDVRAYLEFVEKIERQRTELEKQQDGSLSVETALGFAADAKAAGDEDNTNPIAPSIQRVGDLARKMRTQWVELANRFDLVLPPAECRQLGQLYSGSLHQVAGVLGDLTNALSNPESTGTEQKEDVTSIGERHKTYIDQPAGGADKELARICQKYDTQKWFEIKEDPDGGPASMLKQMNLKNSLNSRSTPDTSGLP